MNTKVSLSWKDEIGKSSIDQETAQRLITELQFHLDTHSGQPAMNQKELSETRTNVNAKIAEIKKEAVALSRSISTMSQDSENAIYFGHFQSGSISGPQDDRSIANELFLNPLLSNLATLIGSIDLALQHRRWPGNRPRDSVRNFWIERLVDCFYRCKLEIHISDSRKSLFYRVAWDFLRELGLEEERSNLQTRLKREFSSNPQVPKPGGYLLKK